LAEQTGKEPIEQWSLSNDDLYTDDTISFQSGYQVANKTQGWSLHRKHEEYNNIIDCLIVAGVVPGFDDSPDTAPSPDGTACRSLPISDHSVLYFRTPANHFETCAEGYGSGYAPELSNGGSGGSQDTADQGNEGHELHQEEMRALQGKKNPEDFLFW
jgi:hypothetical protein